MTDLICMFCAAGLYEECVNPQPVEGEPGWVTPCGFVNEMPTADAEDVERNPVGRPMKRPSEVTDPLSTGRKQAQRAAPIFDFMVCSWAGLRHAGGGSRPIVGCRGNIIADVKRNSDLPEGTDARGERHHGPDKNVLNNSVGHNLHVICARCHKRWHALNDRSYGPRPEAGRQFLPDAPYWPHDALTKATEEELDQSEEWWEQRTENRPADTYPLSVPDIAPLEPPKPISADELIEEVDNTYLL